MSIRKNMTKTKYAGTYFTTDKQTKVKTFIVRIKVNGIDTEQIVGYSNDQYKTNASLAYQKRVELINQYKTGKNIRRDTPTVDDFFKEYIELRKRTISNSWYKTNNIFFNTHIPKNIKLKKLKELTVNDLQRIVNKMIDKKYSGRYIKTIKEIFSPLMQKALELDIVEKDITKSLKFPKFDNERKFYLPKEKSQELYQEILNIPDNKYRLMFLFLLRGRRKGEVLTLEWQDINFRTNSYVVRDENNKINEDQTYLLDDELIENFKLIESENTGLIFKSNRTGKKMSDFPRKLWKKITDKLEIEMTFHDFRHLIGFTLVQNNVPLEVISRTFGHKNIKTTQRYSNMREEMAKKGSDAFIGLMKNNS